MSTQPNTPSTMPTFPSTPSSALLPGGALFSTPDREALPAAFLAGYMGEDADFDQSLDDGLKENIEHSRRIVQSATKSRINNNNAKSKSDSSLSGKNSRTPYTPKNNNNNNQQHRQFPPTGSTINRGISSITPLHRRSLGLPSSTPNNNNLDQSPINAFASPRVNQDALPWIPSSVTRFFGKAGRATRASQLGLSPNHLLHRSFEANQSFPRATRGPAGAQPLDSNPEDPEAISTPAPFPHRDNKDRNLIPSSLSAKTGVNVTPADVINGISFSSPQFHGTFDEVIPNGMAPVANHSLGRSWSFLQFLQPQVRGAAADNRKSTVKLLRSTLPAVQMALKNPNKAVLTIDKSSTEILIANDMAGDLFGIPTENLVGTPLSSLLDPSKMRSRGTRAVSESLIDGANGDTLTLAGKVIDVVHAATGVSMSVSVWIHELKSSAPGKEGEKESSAGNDAENSIPIRTPCVVILEPVDRLSAQLDIDADGIIRGLDDNSMQILGFDTREAILGKGIKSILPSIQLPKKEELPSEPENGPSPSSTPPNQDADVIPKEMKKQQATAVSKIGITFPVSLILDLYQSEIDAEGAVEADQENEPLPTYSIVLWVFANISGLLTFDASGIITGYNGFFMLCFLGFDESQLIGLPVTSILPNFYEDLLASSENGGDCEDDDKDDIDDRSWPMPPDLKPCLNDAPLPHHARGETDELLSAADVFINKVNTAAATAATSKSEGCLYVRDDSATEGACILNLSIQDDKSTVREHASFLTSGNYADCEDNGDEAAASKSTIMIEEDDDKKVASKSANLAEVSCSSREESDVQLYSPTMPDRPYSPSDPPYSPSDPKVVKEDPSLVLSCGSSDFDDSNVPSAFLMTPSPMKGDSKSLLNRPENPTPARWRAMPMTPGAAVLVPMTPGAKVRLPDAAEKGRDAACLVANTPKRNQSANLRLLSDAKAGANNDQNSPYSPSQGTPDMKIFTPAKMPSLDSIIPDSPYEAAKTIHLESRDSSMVIIEKNDVSPKYWKSGSVSTYVAIPSPFRERYLQQNNDPALSPCPTASPITVHTSFYSSDNPDERRKSQPLDDSDKVLLSSSFYSDEPEEENDVLPPLPFQPPISHLTQTMSAMSLSTSTPVKETLADPSPVRRRLSLGAGIDAALDLDKAADNEDDDDAATPTALDITDGAYAGKARHSNGAFLGSIYQIKRIFLDAEDKENERDRKSVYCMWLSKDPKDWLEMSQHLRHLGSCDASSATPTSRHSACSSRAHSRGGRGPTALANLTLNTTAGGISLRNESPKQHLEDSFSANNGDSKREEKNVLKSRNEVESEKRSSLSSKYLTRDDINRRSIGDYDVNESPSTFGACVPRINRRQSVGDGDVAESSSSSGSVGNRTLQRVYETLQSIGKGAYGYVKLARRKCDGKTVVVKSIKKSKINVPACWRHDPLLEESTGLAKVPLEVSQM